MPLRMERIEPVSMFLFDCGGRSRLSERAWGWRPSKWGTSGSHGQLQLDYVSDIDQPRTLLLTTTPQLSLVLVLRLGRRKTLAT